MEEKILTEQQEKEVERLYLHEDLIVTKIIKATGYPSKAVKRFVNRKHLYSKKMMQKDNFDYTMLRKLYFEDKLGKREISKIMKVNVNSIAAKIKRLTLVKSTKTAREYLADMEEQQRPILLSDVCEKYKKKYHKGDKIKISGEKGRVSQVTDHQLIVKFKDYKECFTYAEMFQKERGLGN